jgi:tetratricopeptide (TPR) repeat protein
MDKLSVKYATYAKSLAPQPIRIRTPGWAGTPEKMEDGSQPQPWHCLPFVEGSTYGLELLYPYETECHVVNDNGALRFDWDYASEPGGGVTGGEFVTFSPKRAPRHYLFNARIDVVPPPGHVVRVEPHPRFFTDDTGTVPPAVIAHLQNEWWPRLLFVVFKAPAPGQRHVFRKGEPYAQIIFVPHRLGYDLVKMAPEEESRRRELERKTDTAKFEIADNVWHNVDDAPLSSHYKVMSRAFARDGLDAVESVVDKAVERHRSARPQEKSIGESLAAARRLISQEKYRDAKELYTSVLQRDPDNAEALSHLGVCFACQGSPMVGLKLMDQAVALQPTVALYHSNRGELLRLVNKPKEAEASIRAALELTPDDPLTLSILGLVLAQQDCADEAIATCRAAVAMNPAIPLVHVRLGDVYARLRRHADARAAYEAALAIDPNSVDAKDALRQLPADARA